MRSKPELRTALVLPVELIVFGRYIRIPEAGRDDPELAENSRSREALAANSFRR